MKYVVYGQNIGEPKEKINEFDSYFGAELLRDSLNDSGGKLFDGSYARNKFADKNYAWIEEE